MKKQLSTIAGKTWLFVLLILSLGANAQKDKFNMGGNEPTETGPMLIWSSVAFGVAFILLLFFKIRYDKKKKAEAREQMKSMASKPRTHHHTRATASRSRGGATS